MTRRGFLAGAAAMCVAGIPAARSVSAKPWQMDFMRTYPLERTVVEDWRRTSSGWAYRVVTLSRAEVEKRWPSRPEVS